jgi:hypothetical protein
MWENIIWAVCFGLPIAVGGIAMGLNPPDFTLTRLCFIIAASVVLARFSYWISVEHQFESKIIFFVLLCSVFLLMGSTLGIGLQWVNKRELITKQMFHQDQKTLPAQLPEKQPTPVDEPTFKEKTQPKKTIEPTFKEKIEKVTVSFGRGGTTFVFPISDLLKGGIAPTPVVVGNYKPLKIYMENGKLYVDVYLYSGAKNHPIEVKHNEFVVRNSRWDRNFDSGALEVVNESKTPIFQLIYQNPYKIIVNGIFPIPGSGLILADDYGFSFSNALEIPKSFSILRLFKYPSEKFQGIHDEIPKIIPKPKLKERTIFLFNELLNFANFNEREIDKAMMEAPVDNKRTIYMGEMGQLVQTYNDKYLLQCTGIVDELAASNLNVVKLPSLCRHVSRPEDIKEISDKLKQLAEQLP